MTNTSFVCLTMQGKHASFPAQVGDRSLFDAYG